MVFIDLIEYKLDCGLFDICCIGWCVGCMMCLVVCDLYVDVIDDLCGLVDELEDLLKNDGDGDIVVLCKCV